MATIENLAAALEEVTVQVRKLTNESVEHEAWKTRIEGGLVKHEGELNQAVLDQTNSMAEQVRQQQVLVQQHQALHVLHQTASESLSATNTRVGVLESAGSGPSLGAGKAKEKWQLSVPKDMQPSEFTGKEEEWKRWKEEMEDYIEAVHPGMKLVLKVTTKGSEEVLNTDFQKAGFNDGEWQHHDKLFMLLKRKTSGEARSVVMCARAENGYEAWRLLRVRFEPQAGIRRMKEIAELMDLRNKRCKNAAETNLVLLEVNRRKMLIEDIGGETPSDDTLTNVMWMSMDPATKSHVSTKLDPSTVLWVDMKETIMRHTTLVGATGRQWFGQVDNGNGYRIHSLLRGLGCWTVVRWPYGTVVRRP